MLHILSTLHIYILYKIAFNGETWIPRYMTFTTKSCFSYLYKEWNQTITVSLFGREEQNVWFLANFFDQHKFCLHESYMNQTSDNTVHNVQRLLQDYFPSLNKKCVLVYISSHGPLKTQSINIHVIRSCHFKFGEDPSTPLRDIA